jgi:hypothetical protein
VPSHSFLCLARTAIPARIVHRGERPSLHCRSESNATTTIVNVIQTPFCLHCGSLPTSFANPRSFLRNKTLHITTTIILCARHQSVQNSYFARILPRNSTITVLSGHAVIMASFNILLVIQLLLALFLPVLALPNPQATISPASSSSYWVATIHRQGTVAYGNDSSYLVFRNVMSFGAKGVTASIGSF